jgi:hypothetical protein
MSAARENVRRHRAKIRGCVPASVRPAFASPLRARWTALGGLVAVLLAAPVCSVAALAAPGNSAATITGSFGDSCRDFVAHSSKDISHVEFTYRDGRVVKHEDVDSRDVAVDGDIGDEIDLVLVKSGTTENQFDCDRGDVTQCSDGLDNDLNGLADYPADPNCSSAEDNDEGSD